MRESSQAAHLTEIIYHQISAATGRKHDVVVRGMYFEPDSAKDLLQHFLVQEKMQSSGVVVLFADRHDIRSHACWMVCVCAQMLFLPDASARRYLAMPSTGVNLTAVCFCHAKPVERGMVSVCPVCLSIFCDPKLTCETCGTRIPGRTAARPAASVASSVKR